MNTQLELRADVQELEKNLADGGIALRCFDTVEDALDYMDAQLDQTTVGIGGSITVGEMGLYPRLCAHNQVAWPWEGADRADAAKAEAYISSVNGLAATGEIINIDGSCNRIASTMYGHKRVYFVTGVNKLTPDYDSALWRARNIASPKNAQRMGRKTPCAAKGDKCYNCKSPERICRGLSVILQKPFGTQVMEVILINKELGY